MSTSNLSPKEIRTVKPAIAALVVLLLAASPAFAGERIGKTRAGATIYTYNTTTDKDEVFATLSKIVREDAKAGKKRLIYVITGTHGAADGTVTRAGADVIFKYEDLDSAAIIRTSINIRDYQETAPNRWNELSAKGTNCVLVLAWCYSYQWTSNATANGNNGKIVMP